VRAGDLLDVAERCATGRDPRQPTAVDWLSSAMRPGWKP
jgi:hypothetical protein